MHILHFLPVYVPAWQFGGPILSVSRLCEGLVTKGIEVRVITTTAGLPDFPTEKLGVAQAVNGVQVFYYPEDKANGPIRSEALKKSLEDHLRWADLLHLSSIWQPLGLSLQSAAHALNVPVIQTLRGAISPYSWTRGFYKKIPYFFLFELRHLQRAAAIHCTTYQEIAEVRPFRLKPPLELLPNPLDLESLYSDETLGYRWRVQHNIPLDQTLFIVAGRIHHKKGLDLLPPVLKAIENQAWNLLFIGDDDGASASLRKSLDSLDLSHRCHWLPSIPSSDLLHPLNAADFLLLPSRHENFGNIVVEALACGCGVITSDRVGVKDMLAGCPGFTAGPRNKLVWARLLKSALLDHRPGVNSQVWVANIFSQDSIVRDALAIYERILTRHELPT